MLVLTLRDGEMAFVGQDVQVHVLSIKKGSVRIGFKAPKDVEIDRANIRYRKQLSRRETGTGTGADGSTR